MKSYIRFLSRNRLYTAIETVGLSLALAFVIVLTAYIVDDMTCNRMLKNTDNIYLCHLAGDAGCLDEIPGLYEALPDIESSCSVVHNIETKSFFGEVTKVNYGDCSTAAGIMAVSECFFDFFTFPLSEGNPSDALASKYSVVISEHLAATLFPDGNALGKEINVFESNPMRMYYPDASEEFDLDLVVTGIFSPFGKTVFREPDIFIRHDLFSEKQEAMFQGSLKVGELSFVRLKNGAAPEHAAQMLTSEFKAKAAGLYHNGGNMEISLTHFNDIKKQDHERFNGWFDNIRKGRLFGIYLTMSIFIVIVSLLDYIILTISFSRFRLKEIATRQILGTGRKGVTGRCFAEVLMLMSVSGILAVMLALAFRNPVGKILGTEIEPLSHSAEFVIIAVIILTMAAIAGSVPSLILSSYNSIDVIKGEARYRDRSTFGKVFIGFTGFLCIGALSICFAITRQTRHIIDQPFGYQRDSIVCIEFNGGEPNRFFDGLRSLGFVSKAGSYDSLPMNWYNTGIKSANGKYDDAQFIEGNRMMAEILGIGIIEDFGFASDDRTVGKWYICQSSFEASRDYRDGNMLRMWEPVPLSGIVNDFKIGKVKDASSGKLSFLKILDIPEMEERGNPIVKVTTDGDKACRLIEEFYRQKGYNDTIFKAFTLSSRIEDEIKEERNMLRLLTVFSAICLLMTGMTITGMSSYHAKSSEKNNAIRNVFGCPKMEMILKMIIDFSIPVLISAAIAIPVAWTTIERWLENYAVRTDNSPFIYISSFGITMGFAIAAILIQAMRLLRTSPAETLKKE